MRSMGHAHGRLLGLAALALLASLTLSSCGAELTASIGYYGGDWGPAVVQPAREGKPAVYDDNDEVIWFIKDVWLNGPRGDAPRNRIVLCTMREDGSNKREIANIFVDPPNGAELGTSGFSMDVCPATKELAFSYEYGGPDTQGLWICGLDGNRLQRVDDAKIGRTRRVSWCPDGSCIVYERYPRDARNTDRQIYKWVREGNQIVQLTRQYCNREPAVSPDGKTVAYICWPSPDTGQTVIREGPLVEKYGCLGVGSGSSFLHTMALNGENDEPLRTADGKGIWANDPMWSHDGKELAYVGRGGIINLSTRETRHSPPKPMGHWGRKGFVGWVTGGVVISRESDKEWTPLAFDMRQTMVDASLVPSTW